jgi:peptidyl-prolyl cis-trans isomerase B (cyclophilin B)
MAGAVLAGAVASDAATPAAASPRVKLETSKGVIVVELEPQAAPKTVENFLQYVKDGFYDGTIFHRVIPSFMIQGGGFTKDMSEKATRAPIANEANNGLKNDFGTVAMARTNDPNSATAQFFINAKDNAFLNHTAQNQQGWGYCVFGKVVEGATVVKAIETVPTSSKGMFENVPVTPVVITKATIVQAAAPAATPETKPAAKDSTKKAR